MIIYGKVISYDEMVSEETYFSQSMSIIIITFLQKQNPITQLYIKGEITNGYAKIICYDSKDVVK